MSKVDVSDLIGKEFKYLATGPDYWDCWSLATEVSKRFNNILPAYKTIIDETLRSISFEDGKKYFTKIDKKEIKPGDIVTLRIGSRFITHIAIMLDNNRFVHIQRKKRCCIERISDARWEKRVEGIYRLKNNE